MSWALGLGFAAAAAAAAVDKVTGVETEAVVEVVGSALAVVDVVAAAAAAADAGAVLAATVMVVLDGLAAAVFAGRVPVAVED